MSETSCKNLFQSVLLLLLIIPIVAYGADPKIEYKKIQQKMIKQKKRIRSAQKKEIKIMRELHVVNAQLGKSEKELATLRKNLSSIQSQVSSVTTEIEGTQKKIRLQEDWLKRKLRTMNKLGYSGDALMLLLSARDVPQMFRAWKYLEKISLREHRILNGYRDNLQTLDKKNNELQSLKEGLLRSQRAIQSKEKDLARKKQVKETFLASLRNEKTASERKLAELSEASERLRKLIEEASKKAAYTGKDFLKLKGKLPWPVNGHVALPYGEQKDLRFNTPVFRNGIHIKTRPQEKTKAVHKGKVIFADNFKGFGNLVIINHGSDYHTLYGNLSEIFSRVGDIIRKDQVIGTVGTSGLIEASGLYFEIRYKGKPLNPAQWLAKKRR
jgi:septal ring factor EnvC (AmiA/AmiB activator)